MLRAPSDGTPISVSFQAWEQYVQQLIDQVKLGQASLRADHGQSSDMVVAHSTLSRKANADDEVRRIQARAAIQCQGNCPF